MNGAFPTRSSYREAWDKAYVSDPKTILNLDIELAALCNLACPMCFWGESEFSKSMAEVSKRDGKPRKRFMPADMAMDLIDAAYLLDVPALKFNWRGESTLHPSFSQIIESAASYGTFHDLLVNTNGNCPDAAIPGLRKATKVMVSLDSLVPETYAQMRAKGNLERAKEVLDMLIEYEHPNLWVRRVVTSLNREEPFAKMVRERFGKAVEISEHYCFDRNDDKTLELADAGHQKATDRAYCGYPSQRLVVSAEGLVYPCCIDLDEEMPIGDVKRQSLAEIWRSKKLADLRANLRGGCFKSKACQGCRSWMAYTAPQREFVQDKPVAEPE